MLGRNQRVAHQVEFPSTYRFMTVSEYLQKLAGSGQFFKEIWREQVKLFSMDYLHNGDQVELA